MYRSFKKLIRWCPSVKKFLDEGMNNCDAALAFQEVWLTTIISSSYKGLM